MQAINSSLLLRQILSMYKLVTDKNVPCPITINKQSSLVNTQPYLSVFLLYGSIPAPTSVNAKFSFLSVEQD